MKKFIYPACFYLEEDGQYSVLFPDFGGATCGSNLEEALFMSEDYLGSIISVMQDDNEELPKPSDINSIKADEYPNGFVSLACVDMDEYRKKSTKSVKKTLTIPQWLNEIAVSKKINFSKVLKDALQERLEL